MAGVSERYEHHFHRYTDEQYDNLLTLARYLVINTEKIDGEGGLLFDPAYMLDLTPMPDGIVEYVPTAMPPLAHGPLAGIAALLGEDWDVYCERVFGIRILLPDPFCLWLQSPLCRRTEPSAKGAGLRIAYALDYGVPSNYIEIAMGHAHTDYNSSGFLWEKLDLPVELLENGLEIPIRDWPEWIGAPALNAKRAAITLNAGNLRQRLIDIGIARSEDIAGLNAVEIAALEHTTGPMPESYRQVLSLIGRRAGRLVDDRELQIYADQLPSVNRMGRDERAEWEEDGGDPVPDDAIFIGAHYGMSPWFILREPRAHHQRSDSPVFLFDTDTGKVTLVSISVWGLVEGLVRDAETFIAGGISEKKAHCGFQPQLPPRVDLEKDRRTTLFMMAGALLFGAAIYLIYRLTA